MANSESTTVNMLSKRPNNKTVKKTLTCINPEASDRNVSRFVRGLASLSDNTLTDVQKMKRSNIDFEQA